MISFIIIGKNIQRTIEIVLESVFRFVNKNSVTEYEIIYVDSDSNDNTLVIAQQYPIKILLIEGNVNAAIGRNVGAQNAKGNTLFFLDGDMELLPDFFEFVFNKSSQTLKYQFINGYMREKYYDKEFNFLYAKEEKIADKPLFDHVTGGLMIVEKKRWLELGGMDERLIRNQDLDFGLRMSKIGFPVLKDNHYWIIHHTMSYLENNRFSYFYKSKALLTPGILMRKHFLNFTYLKYFRRYVFYALLLITSFTLLFISPVYGILLLLFYLLIQLVRSIVNSKGEEYFIKSFAFKTLFNIYSLLGFLFYYPAKPSYRLTIVK